ncbi:sugar ABC transporter substrate-binding protein [Streptacidiphilus sp. N1-10]|uniref:Sugar ABC transporter substrate-binding protein n=1 Tax=Streptacidiphilus jeojiensis TaxID=3229225 RepID=A0ABV6XZR7_9ACTN
MHTRDTPPDTPPDASQRTSAARRLAGALLAVCCLLLTACGSGSGAASAGANRPTTISYWTWLGGMQQVVDRFNATHSDVRVVLSKIPAGTSGGYSKMFTAVRAGNAPDAATVEYPELPAFATQGAIQDLTPYGGADLESRYPAWVWGMVDQGGKVWGLPRDIAPMVLYYRTDLLAKYGLTVPTTWAQYAADAKAIHRQNPKAVIGAFSTSDSALLAGLAWQAGAQWFSTPGDAWKVSTQDPASDRVAAFWQPLVSGGLVANEPAYAQQWTADLQAGNLVTAIGGPWSAAYLQRLAPKEAGKWAVAPMPQWPGQPAGDGTNGGSTMVMLKGSKHPAQVMEFLDWVSNSPDSIKAVEPVSPGAYPAALASIPVAKQVFDSTQTYYTGTSLFDVAARASQTVGTAWQWGPDMAQSLSDLNDALAGSMTAPGGLRSALDSWERTTRADLRERGMNVSD